MKLLLRMVQQLRLLSLLLLLMVTTTLSAQAYRICLASFTDSANAGNLAEQLRLYGMGTYNESVRLEGKNYIRVILDRSFPTAEAAQAVLNSLKNHPVMVYFQARSPWILPGTAAAETAPTGQTSRPPLTAPSPAMPPASGIAEASVLLSAGSNEAARPASGTAPAESASPEEPLQIQSSPEPKPVIAGLDQAELIDPQVSDRTAPAEAATAEVAAPGIEQAEPAAVADIEIPVPLTREQPEVSDADAYSEQSVELAQAELITPEIIARSSAGPSAEPQAAAVPELPSTEEAGPSAGNQPEAATPLLEVPAEGGAEENGAAPAGEHAVETEPENLEQSEAMAVSGPAVDPESEIAAPAEGNTEAVAVIEAAVHPETSADEEPATETPGSSDNTEAPDTGTAATTQEAPLNPTGTAVAMAAAGAAAEASEAAEADTTTSTVKGNILFATSPVPLTVENSADFPVSFSAPAPIYARAFFREELGTVAGGDLWHELYIDGNFTKREYFEQALEPERLQIPLSITANSYADEFSDLGPGEYTILIRVLRNKRDGQSLIARTGEDGLLYTEPVDILIAETLSEGSFTYIVP